MMKRLLLVLYGLALPCLALAQGGGVSQIPFNISSPSNGECLVIMGPPWIVVNSSCSGSSSTAWANITGGTNSSAALVVGTGASLTYSGSGSVNASEITGLSWPSLVSSDCLTNNGSTLSWGSCGSGGGSPGGSNGQIQYNNDGSFGGFTLAGDCTFSEPDITCTKTNGTSFGTFATQNYATPPAIGGTTPAPGNFTTGGYSGNFSLTGLGTGTVANGLCDTSAGLVITCSPSGVTLQTNGTNNSSQSALNIENGSGIAATNPSGGNVSIALASQSNNTVLCNVSGSSAAPTGCTPQQATSALISATANAQTSSYTAASTDCNGEITENSSSATVVTIPSGVCSGQALLTIEQLGTGAVTLTLGSGVTVTNAGPYNVTGGLGGQNGFVQLYQASSNAWTVSQFIPGNAEFSITGGTCATAASTAGGLTGGTITLPASGTVASCTIIITPAVEAADLWVGHMGDQTQLAVPEWVQSAQGATTITFTLPGATADSDVLTFSVQAE